MKITLLILLSCLSILSYADNNQPLKLNFKSTNGYLIILGDNNIFTIGNSDLNRASMWSNCDTIYSDPVSRTAGEVAYKLYNYDRNDLVDATKISNQGSDLCTKSYLKAVLKNPYGINLTDDTVWWLDNNVDKSLESWQPLDEIVACKNTNKIINASKKQTITATKIKLKK